jgi:hypothetical protein
VKVNTKNRHAVSILVDHKPAAMMKIIGDSVLAGKDLDAHDGIVLRLVCNGRRNESEVRWTYEGLGGWVRGDALFVGFNPGLPEQGQPGVVSCPVDAKHILARLRWFNPDEDSIAGEGEGTTVEAQPREVGQAEEPGS